jgi:hypothetical protein
MYLLSVLCIYCLYYVGTVCTIYLLSVLCIYCLYYVGTVCTMYLLSVLCIYCLVLTPDGWLEVSNRKVLRPAISTQVFLGFPGS